MKVEILYDASDGTVVSINHQPALLETAQSLSVSSGLFLAR